MEAVANIVNRTNDTLYNIIIYPEEGQILVLEVRQGEPIISQATTFLLNYLQGYRSDSGDVDYGNDDDDVDDDVSLFVLPTPFNVWPTHITQPIF
ncbi:unnamed protein product [Thelazia callipaeda]|uniref:SM-ATX domain-containing protein n=1 Tax=Thelazia callipaeda TaxID=103827 RepID=A0A0N5CW09_THECL|nr:unnamed protein product [Thelazia callipaeda]